MAIFNPKRRMLRGPHRRVLAIHGGASLLTKYWDISTGTCQVSAQTLTGSAFNAVASGSWNWQSYDRVCSATNTMDVSGGGLVASGLGAGTFLRPLPSTSPLVCTAFLVDSAV